MRPPLTLIAIYLICDRTLPAIKHLVIDLIKNIAKYVNVLRPAIISSMELRIVSITGMLEGMP